MLHIESVSELNVDVLDPHANTIMHVSLASCRNQAARRRGLIHSGILVLVFPGGCVCVHYLLRKLKQLSEEKVSDVLAHVR